MHTYRGVVCLTAGLLALTAIAQAESKGTKANNSADSSTVAYIYVANTPKNSSTNQISGYAAASDGSLTPLAGSPFMEDVASMAVDGSHLLAATRRTPEVNTYTIQQDGGLAFQAATDFGQYNGSNDCGDAGQIFFDHSGAFLYVQEFDATDACANTAVASFALHKSTGKLSYLGTAVTGAFPGDNMAAYFIGNNKFAYSAVNSACMYYAIYGFGRASSGELSNLNLTNNLPTPGPGVSEYVPNLAAADPTNHVAFTEQPANPPGCAPGPLQLAVYTADASGNLTTTSTYENMPATKIVNAYDMKTSPSGKLLAVAGQEGLQVFHFNGASPITQYTGLLTSSPINQMYWDNSDHLYAISQAAGKIYVFTLTPTECKQAPGSPYTIASPDNIAVQPYPLP